MRVSRLARSKSPLSTASILDLFQKVDGSLPIINFDTVQKLSPTSGELFILEGLDGSIVDGKTYASSSDIFHESQFDVVIDKTQTTPKIFRFVYYNRQSKYRIVHYLVCDQRQQASSYTPSDTILDKIAQDFLEEYELLKNIFFKPVPEEREDALDRVFWENLVQKHLPEIMQQRTRHFLNK
ncbi:hypothetical protein NEAUS05_1951 [Nematocida ausubeli]|nr:hypothetical protein NEAUS05_1951 [Nematocida ausubeli]